MGLDGQDRRHYKQKHQGDTNLLSHSIFSFFRSTVQNPSRKAKQLPHGNSGSCRRNIRLHSFEGMIPQLDKVDLPQTEIALVLRQLHKAARLHIQGQPRLLDRYTRLQLSMMRYICFAISLILHFDDNAAFFPRCGLDRLGRRCRLISSISGRINRPFLSSLYSPSTRFSLIGRAKP